MAQANINLSIDGNNFSKSKSYNNIYENVQEIDNTPSNERYAFYHPVGNFEEVQADGTRINKIKGSDYEIIAEDKNVVIKDDKVPGA